MLDSVLKMSLLVLHRRLELEGKVSDEILAP